MSAQGLNYQRLEFPFSRGLNQKADPRLTQEPELVRAVDVDFDNLGGLRGRYPYASIGANIFGGGTISGCRRVYALGSELLLFTQTALYSWSPQQSAWVSRGTHLAIKTDEKPAFVNTSDQVQCDRAELSGTVVYAWVELSAGSSVTGQVYAAAVDKTTGAVLVAPTAITSAVTRPRLVATTTKILLFSVTATPDLVVRAISPSDPATGFASASTNVLTSAGGFNTRYDAVANVGVDGAVVACRYNPTTSYVVATVSAGLTVATSTKARTCDGGIAVAVSPTGTIQIARCNGSNIQGDYLTSALVDTTTGQAIGSIAAGTATEVTCAYRSTQNSSQYRCYVFWSNTSSISGSSDNTVEYNYVDTGGTIGTETTLTHRVILASRAFDYNGSVYVNVLFDGTSSFVSVASILEGVFESQLQNSYFLYRDDGTLCAKMAAGRCGGSTACVNWLPGVALTSGSTGYSWCGNERRIVPVGTLRDAYTDRGPLDITITFDSNEARRVAKIGETIYVTGAEPMQFDGEKLTEWGFHIFPWYAAGVESSAGAGTIPNGDYAVKCTYRWDNAKGERDRSASATVGVVTIATGPSEIDYQNTVPLYVTHKTSRAPAIEWWRTAVNPSGDSPFFLVTGQDPADTTGDNCYVPSDPTATSIASLTDAYDDDTLTAKEAYGSSDVLENLPPPPHTLITANDERVFIAGIAGDPHHVRYSKQRTAGFIAAFHEALSVAVPEPGGDIVGLAFLNETLVVFRETAIYALDGIGFDNVGGGQNYQARLVSNTEGAVNQESICLTPSGLVFKSSKGWYLLNRGWTTQYIGGPVRDYDSESVYSAHVVESTHQVRIITSGRALVWDYLVGNWFEWTISDGLHATIYGGTYHYLATASVKAEQSSYSTADYAWDVEMLIHLGGLQNFGRVRRVIVGGEVRGTGTIRVRIGSYAEATYFDDKTWTISPTTAGSELDVEHQPSQQQHKAFRVRLTSQTTAGEKPQLSAIALEVGFKQPVYRLRPSAQKQ